MYDSELEGLKLKAQSSMTLPLDQQKEKWSKGKYHRTKLKANERFFFF